MSPSPYLDTVGLWDATAAWPDALGAVDDVGPVGTPSGGPSDVASVALFGAGASALATRAVELIGGPRCRVPLWAGRGPEVPGFVGPTTLVVALSASGDSAPTREAALTSATRGASVVVVTGGGALGEWARSSDLPVTSLAPGPPGRIVSRCALGSATASILMVLARAGVLADVTPSLSAARVTVQRRRDALLQPGNMAEELARRIGRSIALVYGAGPAGALAARRWKEQVNANAKTPAFWGAVPEVSYGEVAGWGQHGDVTRQVFTLVALRHHGEDELSSRRFDAVLGASDEVVGSVLSVRGEGEDDLGRFFDLALVGDFVSLHMAGREGVDPGPLAVVDDIEGGLSP